MKRGLMNKWKKLRKLFLLRQKAAKQYNDAIDDIQKLCNHPNVAECDYIPESGKVWGGGTAIPPHRICEVCLLKEPGWGSGYHKLAHSDRTITRDCLFNMTPDTSILAQDA